MTMSVTIPDDANEQFMDVIRRYPGGARLAQTDLPEKLAEKVQSWLAASLEADHARERAMAGGRIYVESTKPIRYLSSPCAGCGHTHNWHTPGPGCVVIHCPCKTYTDEAPQGAHHAD